MIRKSVLEALPEIMGAAHLTTGTEGRPGDRMKSQRGLR